MKKILKNFIFLPLILVGAIAFVVMQVKSKPAIEHEEATYPVKAVEVITIKQIPFRARAIAYGNVEPKVVLKSKSEVSGKISYIHPNLKKGASLKKGTVVLRIETTSFKISLNQSKAGLAGSQSSLAQLEAEEKSTKRALSISRKNLNVGLKELKRIQTLWDKRLISRSTLDKEEQKVLSLRQQVQDIQGKLSAYASRKAATQAQITQSKSQVNQSQDTLGKTEVTLPFDARIGEVPVEKGEFVPAGGLLFEALGVQAIEITAELPTKQFRHLFTGTRGKDSTASSIEKTSTQTSAISSIRFSDPSSIQTALSNMNLEARVRLVGDASDTPSWKGKFIRLSESVDPTRDTLGAIIEVENPYSGIIPGKRPPLLKGMYTSVELLSSAQPSLVIPRKALHQGRVYIANSDNELEIHTVNSLFTQGNLVVLDSKKDSHLLGKNLIISDMIPVMQGLPLKVITANDYQKSLILDALAKRPLATEALSNITTKVTTEGNK